MEEQSSHPQVCPEQLTYKTRKFLGAVPFGLNPNDLCPSFADFNLETAHHLPTAPTDTKRPGPFTTYPSMNVDSCPFLNISSANEQSPAAFYATSSLEFSHAQPSSGRASATGQRGTGLRSTSGEGNREVRKGRCTVGSSAPGSKRRKKRLDYKRMSTACGNCRSRRRRCVASETAKCVRCLDVALDCVGMVLPRRVSE
ncbi:hypothetical protein DB88DRAFT_223553 [Papiliotrema laurentii]|uniref:Zn(2)-C6 fungal-type domain-containing protein n=1 Tax=Papiliotrema laurentii TaxID=5418 RepID=A0AAD9L5P0_PAPLA|nr:hypothetical protein DB88DRAFT_223553 [Papiliotrema laurentii]